LNLDLLSADDKKKLLDRLLADQMLNAKDTGSDREIAMWAEAVHQALTDLVGGSGGMTAGPVLLRKVLRVGTAWEPIATFMKASKLHDLPVVERQKAYNLLAHLLVRYARQAAARSGAPLAPKLLANCTQNIAGVFESAFPGYVHAGLAKVAVRADVVTS
jgi:hypothetical protein